MNNREMKITLISDPILLSRDGFVKILRRIASISYTIKLGLSQLKFGGHPGVTRSVIAGMNNLGVEFNYNPASKSMIYENVVVLSSVKALKQAIELKKCGKIKNLVAGPNVMDVPTDYNKILASKEIDLCIVPSNWRRDMFVYFDQEMETKCKVWASGIDSNYWCPKEIEKENKVLIYLKNRTEDETDIKDFLKEIKEEFESVVTIKYGSFSRDFFKKQLNEVQCMVAFTSGSETQGLVWAEAWSMNVPTFILKHTTDQVRGHKIASSSAPYLTEQTGAFFSNKEDLRENLKNVKIKKDYSPRDWVLNNMSDEICAKKLLDIIKSI